MHYIQNHCEKSYLTWSFRSRKWLFQKDYPISQLRKKAKKKWKMTMSANHFFVWNSILTWEECIPNLCSFSKINKILSQACSVAPVVSDSLWPYAPQPAGLLCPWDSPGQNTRVGCCALLQGIFLLKDWICVSSVSFTDKQVLYF